MSTVVLVNPDMELLQESFGTVTLTKLKPQPPLGLCAIAAPLDEAGHHVIIIDAYADSLSSADLAEQILNLHPDIVGFSITCLSVAQAEDTAELLKESTPNIVVVFGGPQMTLQPESSLQCHAVDFGIVGEGDYSFPLLVNAITDETCPSQISGLIMRKTTTELYYSPKTVPITNLDVLPFPARHLLNWDNYDLSGDYLIPAKQVFTLSSSRGCPYSCTFCSSAVFWNCSYHARSASSVVDEIETLIKDYGADGLNFREDNFMVDKQRVASICIEIIKRGIKIPWICEARVDNVDRDTLTLMQQAGLVGLWCGIESGSPDILKQIKKGYTVEQVRSAFKIINELGLSTRAGFMIGFPDEKEKDIWQTFDLALEISPTHAYFQTYVAFPRGELYDYVVSNALYCDQWRDAYKVKQRFVDVEKYPQFEIDLREKFDKEKLSRPHISGQFRGIGDHVLVFCTAGITIVESAIAQFKKENPSALLDALSNQTMAHRIADNKEVSQLYVYNTDHITSETFSEEVLNSLTGEKYDAILVVFSNGLGQGYEEVINIAKSLNTGKIVSFNRLGIVNKL